MSNWDAIHHLKNLPGAEIRRLDIALTTFMGEIKHEQVVEAHRAGMFTTGGRPPNLRQITSSDPAASRTCYVGSRQADKYFRGYEKGKQLAAKLAPAGRWETFEVEGYPAGGVYRCEVEFKAGAEAIAWDAIAARDRFFAGAYPFCETVLPGIRPRTFCRGRKVGSRHDMAAALAHIRRQFGGTLYTALVVNGGDIGAVWEQICGTAHSPRLLRAGVLLEAKVGA
ncbi:replication initiation factor domain-containing protein [Ramlibacter rhizophilus]|uniref:replication initiation factor domain-containing protein n=1 Tax=Ramlibacter rhizophilus TaxID=1781167 RepID=UPI0014326A1D|nr:replication initiation factor domain-containing protein [Ramlibacter rhizophilus]